MATNVQNASGIMNALMDWRGKGNLSAGRKIQIAERIADHIGIDPPPETNDEKADAFLQFMWQQVAHTLRQRAENNQRAADSDGVTQAGDDEVADL